MNEEILKAAGLSLKEAEIYQILLENGEMKAGKLDKLTPYKRGVVYKMLESLVEKGLVLKLDSPGKVASFRVEHPIKIREKIEEQAEKLKIYQKTLEETLPQFISTYNLAFNKPGIKFYEGEEGIIKILDDTLLSKTEVLLFINPQIFDEEKYKTINEEYKKKRERAKITKKIIRLGKPPELTFGTAEEKYDAVTQIRYMDEPSFPFASSIQIYDGKISYQLLDKGNIISILIHSQHIYEMHKTWFDYVWKKLDVVK